MSEERAAYGQAIDDICSGASRLKLLCEHDPEQTTYHDSEEIPGAILRVSAGAFCLRMAARLWFEMRSNPTRNTRRASWPSRRSFPLSGGMVAGGGGPVGNLHQVMAALQGGGKIMTRTEVVLDILKEMSSEDVGVVLREIEARLKESLRDDNKDGGRHGSGEERRL